MAKADKEAIYSAFRNSPFFPWTVYLSSKTETYVSWEDQFLWRIR